MPELNPKDEQNSIKSRGDKYSEQREQHVQSSIGIICMKDRVTGAELEGE